MLNHALSTNLEQTRQLVTNLEKTRTQVNKLISYVGGLSSICKSNYKSLHRDQAKQETAHSPTFWPQKKARKLTEESDVASTQRRTPTS